MIPRGRSGAKVGGDVGIGRPNRNDREQSKQRGSRPRDGEIGQLPLRLDAKMRAAFLKCRFDGPTMDEPSENLDRRRIKISDLDLKLLDQQIAVEMRVFRRLARSPFGVKFLALRSDKTVQRFDVVGKRVRHIRFISQKGAEWQLKLL